MAELPDVFKASEEPTMEDGQKALPEGWYPAQITKSEFKENNKKTGQFLSLGFSIIEGEFAKRMVWANLNLIHQNDTTVQIARRELSSICAALNLESVLDSEELHGSPLQIKLIVEPATSRFPEKNVIKGYKNIDEVVDGPVVSDESSPF